MTLKLHNYSGLERKPITSIQREFSTSNIMYEMCINYSQDTIKKCMYWFTKRKTLFDTQSFMFGNHPDNYITHSLFSFMFELKTFISYINHTIWNEKSITIQTTSLVEFESVLNKFVTKWKRKQNLGQLHLYLCILLRILEIASINDPVNYANQKILFINMFTQKNHTI
jgi:hypothetical protein